MEFVFPVPKLQIDFATQLFSLKDSTLQKALLETVSKMRIAQIDSELNKYVPEASLSALASLGLRGELMFPVPSVLRENPRLFSYYRMLLGYSQKEFYKKSETMNLTYFLNMEKKGILGATADAELENMCHGLCKAVVQLLHGIGHEKVTKEVLNELTILTLGSFLRGSNNNKIGIAGLNQVISIIREIVGPNNPREKKKSLELTNATNHRIIIEWTADPDIVISEILSNKERKYLLAIEVKAGTDISNIHNRFGEAEKSHNKAVLKEIRECWTVFNVPVKNIQAAGEETQKTNRFYYLQNLLNINSDEYADFCRQLRHIISVSD